MKVAGPFKARNGLRKGSGRRGATGCPMCGWTATLASRRSAAGVLGGRFLGLNPQLPSVIAPRWRQTATRPGKRGRCRAHTTAPQFPTGRTVIATNHGPAIVPTGRTVKAQGNTLGTMPPLAPSPQRGERFEAAGNAAGPCWDRTSVDRTSPLVLRRPRPGEPRDDDQRRE